MSTHLVWSEIGIGSPTIGMLSKEVVGVTPFDVVFTTSLYMGMTPFVVTIIQLV